MHHDVASELLKFSMACVLGLGKRLRVERFGGRFEKLLGHCVRLGFLLLLNSTPRPRISSFLWLIFRIL